MVTDRSLMVLRAIVEDYVATSEPVGSKALVDRHQFGVSAATIRNDMAMLEEENLIMAPHTSAGRVPTDKGYRVFVDAMRKVRAISEAQKRAIVHFLDHAESLEDALAKAVSLLSQLTNQLAVLQMPVFTGHRIRHLELVGIEHDRVLLILITERGQVFQRSLDDGYQGVDLQAVQNALNRAMSERGTFDDEAELQRDLIREIPGSERLVPDLLAEISQLLEYHGGDRLVVAGTTNLVRTEQDFSGTVVPILEAIEEQVTLLRLMAAMPATPSGVSVKIGSEHGFSGLRQAAMVASDYKVEGEISARLGIIGPTRMDYPRNMAAVHAVSRYLSSIIG